MPDEIYSNFNLDKQLNPSRYFVRNLSAMLSVKVNQPKAAVAWREYKLSEHTTIELLTRRIVLIRLANVAILCTPSLSILKLAFDHREPCWI